MLRSTMSPRELLFIEASGRQDYGVEPMNRRSAMKPVNVAGCRDRSSSSARRLRKATPDRSTEFMHPMPNALSYTEGKRVAPVLTELVSAQNTLDVVAPASVATRLRRRLKGMKRVPFFNCVSSTLMVAEKPVREATPKATEKPSQGKAKQRKKRSMSNSSDPLEAEPSLRIRALFPDAAESRKKIILTDSLSKLKKSVFKARSTTPTKRSDNVEPGPAVLARPSLPNRGTEPRTVSPIYSSTGGRCRRRQQLVKMMEKKLEERYENEKGRDENCSAPKCSEQTTKTGTADVRRDRYQIRIRKIRNPRSKARKAAHRRTATC